MTPTEPLPEGVEDFPDDEALRALFPPEVVDGVRDFLGDGEEDD
jgi:hypothetical protein